MIDDGSLISLVIGDGNISFVSNLCLLFSTIVNYDGYKEDCSYDETLSRLCKFKNFFDYTDIEGSIDFITFNIKNGKGYLWFTYSQKLIVDEKIKINEDNTLCLVQYKSSNNKWVAEKIYFKKNK